MPIESSLFVRLNIHERAGVCTTSSRLFSGAALFSVHVSTVLSSSTRNMIETRRAVRRDGSDVFVGCVRY